MVRQAFSRLPIYWSWQPGPLTSSTSARPLRQLLYNSSRPWQVISKGRLPFSEQYPYKVTAAIGDAATAQRAQANHSRIILWLWTYECAKKIHQQIMPTYSILFIPLQTQEKRKYRASCKHKISPKLFTAWPICQASYVIKTVLWPMQKQIIPNFRVSWIAETIPHHGLFMILFNIF